jgi:ABC-2 type transport system ATP-binding protein
MTVVTHPSVEEVRMEERDDIAIEVMDVSVRYGQRFALRDLSLRVPRGAVYGLVGPSGAGKSTTLRVLAALTEPEAGIVRVDGVDLRVDPRAARARIGYLPDVFGVYEAFTVREYLDFYAALFGVPARRRRQSTGELLELFGLTEQRDLPVRLLSRGPRQQLGMARCLVHDPSVLLLDEPAAGMDPGFRVELLDILAELAQLGKTLVISTNLLAEMAGIFTHLAVMLEGRLLAEGEITALAIGDESLDDLFERVTGARSDG